MNSQTENSEYREDLARRLARLEAALERAPEVREAKDQGVQGQPSIEKPGDKDTGPSNQEGDSKVPMLNAPQKKDEDQKPLASGDDKKQELPSRNNIPDDKAQPRSFGDADSKSMSFRSDDEPFKDSPAKNCFANVLPGKESNSRESEPKGDQVSSKQEGQAKKIQPQTVPLNESGMAN